MTTDLADWSGNECSVQHSKVATISENVLTENLLLNLKKVAGEVAGRASCDAVP